MSVRRSITVLLSLALTGVAIYLAPVQAGGQTSFSVVDGISMNPGLHAGDLVVSRTAPTYHVGDAVLYHNQVLHRDVLHRIFKIQGGHYYFKGDNNAFIDPGYATRGQLVGKMWFSVPNAGTALTWVGKPLNASLFAGGMTLMLLLGFGASKKRRKRRRHDTTATRTRRRLFHRPRKTPENLVFFGAGLLACLVAAVGFTTPLNRTDSIPGAYTQRGSFSYSGTATGLPAVYPTGSVRTGQTVFLAHVRKLRLGFSYRFDTNHPHDIHGTAKLRVVVNSDALAWHRDIGLAATAFAGDSIRLQGFLDLEHIRALAQRLETAAGAVGAQYDVAVKAVVNAHGVVDGAPVEETFTPTLPMSMTQTLLKVVPPAPLMLPGATYTTPTAASLLLSALHPTQSGSIPGTTANTLSVLRYRVPVSAFRGLALALAALALLALLLKPLRPKREIWSHEKRVAHRHGCILVPVAEIAAAPETAIVTVPRFEGLVALAEQQDEPIMQAVGEERVTYAVPHGRHLYVFEAPVPPQVVEPAPVEQPVRRPHKRRRPRRFVHTVSTLFIVVALLGSLSLVFTAANVVPPSNAGTVEKPATAAQLAPAACSGLGLTSVLYVGDNTFSNTTSHVLIIGRSGKDTINDRGQFDCIAAGSGPDVVVADATSICIANTNPQASYRGCTKS